MLEQKKRLLLYRLRKEMNGAALDTMRYFGEDYARNYGVQIYAIRNLAREIGTDHELAKSFYTENIREVRLVALWIADAELVSVEDFDFWASGIINSEVTRTHTHTHTHAHTHTHTHAHDESAVLRCRGPSTPASCRPQRPSTGRGPGHPTLPPRRWHPCTGLCPQDGQRPWCKSLVRTGL